MNSVPASCHFIFHICFKYVNMSIRLCIHDYIFYLYMLEYTKKSDHAICILTFILLHKNQQNEFRVDMKIYVLLIISYHYSCNYR